jgi:digalactosyldiacylglycerol synthase
LTSASSASSDSERAYNTDQECSTQCTPSPLSGFFRKQPLLTMHNDTPPQQQQPEESLSVTSCVSRLDSYSEYDYTDEELLLPNTATFDSDMRRPRPIWIVTTAALPWYTGTAVNPLLRAAHLCSRFEQVHLVVPWLEAAEDRIALYGSDWKDATQQQQEDYLRNWLSKTVPQAATALHIHFYPARYHASLSSIFAMGDLCEMIDCDTSDALCILEEPEHVNFYRAPGVVSWRRKFKHCVGIIHTNYSAYCRHHYSGLVTGPIVGALSAWIVRAYCDKVIKLSPVLQDYALEKEVVCNVHGIRKEFLESDRPSGNKCYFVGKLLWAKGLDLLLDLQYFYKRKTGSYFAMDVLGSGPEEQEIQQAFCAVDDSKKRSLLAWRQEPMPVQFKGRQDHASLGSEYKIFINPSVTEVLCTTTAEAIAMGKFVIVPKHSSNTFFEAFPNCLQYSTKLEFLQVFQYALSHDPEPLSDYLTHLLTWEAATERLLDVAFISERDAARRDRIGGKWDERIAKLHYEIGKGHRGDTIRKIMGAGPVADQVKYEALSTASSASSLCGMVHVSNERKKTKMV